MSQSAFNFEDYDLSGIKIEEKKKLNYKSFVDSLSKFHKSGSLVLVLGAGISSEFGLPDWNGLLQNLIADTFEEHVAEPKLIADLFTKLITQNPLILGRHLQNWYEKKNKSLEQVVRDCLYKDFDNDKHSELIKEIINLKKLDSIITYNYDNIIECKIREFINVQSLFEANQHSTDDLPIYHVHGFLPNDIELNERNQITLGEAVYHKHYTDVYCWSNIIQINKFSSKNCVFIGISLLDPNIRRLLDIAKKSRKIDDKIHFMFKKKHTKDEIDRKYGYHFIELKEKNCDFDVERGKENLLYIIHKFEEEDAKSFGIKIIWVENWTDIPKFLKKINENE